MAAALFGSTAGGRSQSKNLVEFRAGKMYLKSKMCHPDKRKGMVYIYQSDDSLMHFCWKDRTSGAVEDDLIIFPDDCEFKLVPQCTTGRVYVLKFKSSTRKFIFWMQEPKTDKDEDHCKKVNEYLNNPPTPGSSRGGGGMSGLPPDLAGLGDSDLQSILGGMSQQQLMQLLGGMGMGGMGGLTSMMGARPASAQSTDSSTPLRVQSSPGPRATSADSTVTPAPRPATAAALPSQPSLITAQQPVPQTAPPAGPQAPTPGAGGTPIQLSDLQNILSNMTVPAASGATGSSQTNVDLVQALNPDSLIPILANKEVQQRLVPFLPQGGSLPKSEEELRATVSAPQFQQALSTFSAALASGQLGPLMGQFGLGEEVANAAAQGDVEAFVRAMQNAEQGGEGKDEGRKEEKMDES
ncbi:proteasomal ubiquitin receptor ADRM1 isoform X2 [Lingula anatina]|uniref:Proteasomal ubiquitin receptor ADRM1 isoform X1 n=1 Tax=Lingula anatina TaxID=7574 RepID=A0A1S3JG06_LINAN|nr:proteasomal ubiquitin receptor ADRM1 isoform X1 [Lingula anatina]XP_013409293.1 proteasomal ubiquitin receptor ADRM1 isoform X2 [Lingula anatina]|eukprot:XP_013409292.1 proteasomal ubiquitin receptor ADRM1 isoform X1 [Lingula anatina]